MEGQHHGMVDNGMDNWHGCDATVEPPNATNGTGNAVAVYMPKMVNLTFWVGG